MHCPHCETTPDEWNTGEKETFTDGHSHCGWVQPATCGNCGEEVEMYGR